MSFEVVPEPQQKSFHRGKDVKVRAECNGKYHGEVARTGSIYDRRMFGTGGVRCDLGRKQLPFLDAGKVSAGCAANTGRRG